MKTKPIASIDTAIRIYYTYPEIGNKEISELFDLAGKQALSKYKKAVKEEQVKRGVHTLRNFTVNTKVAYEVWGIDVEDLEVRRVKLKKLGMEA